MVFAENLHMDTRVTLENKPSIPDFINFLDAFVMAYYGHDQHKVVTVDVVNTINIPLKLIHETPNNRLTAFATIIRDPHFCEKYLINHKHVVQLDADFIINHLFLRQFNTRFYTQNIIFCMAYWLLCYPLYILWCVIKLGLLGIDFIWLLGKKY